MLRNLVEEVKAKHYASTSSTVIHYHKVVLCKFVIV